MELPEPRPENQKKNSNRSVNITSKGTVVCVGQYNTIEVNQTDEAIQTNKSIKAPDDSTPDNKKNTPADEHTSITITLDNPDGITVIGSNNTIIQRPVPQPVTKDNNDEEKKEDEEDKEDEKDANQA
ncbi:hypothetical protein [Cardinium endosymbiont of Philonthus spinipes]|uniref:hypothetical protein n=1 Tax=Cardinium endosymbiont of Philonthus spinipes TaxID=3077941 RepID=UPI00313B7ADC